MDTQQMFQELDRLYAQGKLDEAEEKMMGWMKEGLDSGNKSLCLMMCNEMEGLYRNTGRVAQAVDMADMALSLIAGMGLDGSIHHGTTLLNAATARRMAGDVEKALSQREATYWSQFSIRQWIESATLVGYFTGSGDVINGTTWFLILLFFSTQ